MKSINNILETDILANYADPRPGDVKHSLSNIGKIRQLLDYEPEIGFYEGLKLVINSMQ